MVDNSSSPVAQGPSLGMNIVPSTDQHGNPWVTTVVLMGAVQMQFSVPAAQAEDWVKEYSKSVVAASKVALRQASGLVVATGVPSSLPPGGPNGKVVR